MTKLKGKVTRSDLEGGFWTFETDEGDEYKLEGGDKTLLQEGKRAEIEGTLEEGEMGIGFGAPVFKVKSHKAL